jgi:Na+-transporting NADH:ubiquinone oxidoreductase subunit NqrF
VNKHEMEARTAAQEDEWKRNLDIMKAKADAARGDAKVTYSQNVAQLQQQFDEFKVQAAKAWDVADDAWDQTSKDLETKWAEWELRAKSAWNDLTKQV